MGLDAVTTFEQAWRDAYGTLEAWEAERYGTLAQARGECYPCPQRARRDIPIRELLDARDAARLGRWPHDPGAAPC